jgi:hypothetical protein
MSLSQRRYPDGIHSLGFLGIFRAVVQVVQSNGETDDQPTGTLVQGPTGLTWSTREDWAPIPAYLEAMYRRHLSFPEELVQ